MHPHRWSPQVTRCILYRGEGAGQNQSSSVLLELYGELSAALEKSSTQGSGRVSSKCGKMLWHRRSCELSVCNHWRESPFNYLFYSFSANKLQHWVAKQETYSLPMDAWKQRNRLRAGNQPPYPVFSVSVKKKSLTYGWGKSRVRGEIVWAGCTETPANINVQMEPRFMLDFIDF